jgi:acetylornithine aminotransferase
MTESAEDALTRVLSDQRADHFTYLADAVTDFAVSRADLIYVFDAYGNKFLDLSAGDGVMVTGHGNVPVIGAIHEQLVNYGHTARSGEHVMAFVSEYAKALSATFPEADGAPQQVLFCASPLEARLHAVRLAAAVTGRDAVVSVASQPGALDRSSLQIAENVDEDVPWGTIAAFVLELVDPDLRQLDEGWVRLTTERAERRGTQVIVDESRTGYGRTGSLWCHQQYGLDPAITVLGGAGGGGLPFGAVVASHRAFEAYPVPARLFGATAAICRAGSVVLSQLTPMLLEHVVDCGHVFDEAVTELYHQFPDIVTGSHGLGLSKGLVCATEDAAQRFFAGCVGHSLLLRPPVGRTLTITPPLVISESELRHAVDVMASVALDWTEPL